MVLWGLTVQTCSHMFRLHVALSVGVVEMSQHLTLLEDVVEHV